MMLRIVSKIGIDTVTSAWTARVSLTTGLVILSYQHDAFVDLNITLDGFLYKVQRATREKIITLDLREFCA